ncbi:hypothetical protein [Amycolatopsis sp. FDAARGOS 1241]|uniref:hypothetical protein n=1 Tax=Amycolatopsis sp. FDAARGOS 1241 TaxID=2778070 RepID=UPI001950C26A|nr:hypothetical protein [Amycolatopsis sp. FDAARGOS 1241]QRP47303.1 hypothetical protein I6J71_04710 [Amycolatopsis sp. FDAARGOS 1241]
MTTTLTDRYVAATVRHVAGTHREEIDRELRAAIADDVEARVALGESPSGAEYAALADLGDPAHLATRYADKATVLIGPATYLHYVRALKLLCATVLPIAYVVNGIGHWVRGGNVGAAIFSPLGATLTVAVYLLAGVTVLYVLVDRFGSDRGAGEPDEEWAPDQLPFADAASTTTWSEVVSGCVLAVLVVVVLFGQRSATPSPRRTARACRCSTRNCGASGSRSSWSCWCWRSRWPSSTCAGAGGRPRPPWPAPS